MKNIVLIFISFFIVGCATQTKLQPKKPVKSVSEFYQSHPNYGEVKADHPEYLKAKEECELDVYSAGVEIEGKLIKDRNELNKLSTSHMSEYIKNRMYKDLDINGAYHGANAAIAVTTGNYSYSYKSKKKPKSYVDYMTEYQGIPKPKEIDIINALQKGNIKCMREDKLWVPGKIVKKNADTGEVISVFNPTKK